MNKNQVQILRPVAVACILASGFAYLFSSVVPERAPKHQVLDENRVLRQLEAEAAQTTGKYWGTTEQPDKQGLPSRH